MMPGPFLICIRNLELLIFDSRSLFFFFHPSIGFRGSSSDIRTFFFQETRLTIMRPQINLTTLAAFIFSTLPHALTTETSNGPTAYVSIHHNPQYVTARPCAAECLWYQGVWTCGLNSGYYDLAQELQCGCDALNNCYCGKITGLVHRRIFRRASALAAPSSRGSKRARLRCTIVIVPRPTWRGLLRPQRR